VGDPSYIRLESRLNRLDDSYSVILHVTKEIPRRWGVVVGDVCHNLRSALDHLVVATIPPGQAHRRHQFPIFDSDQSWNSEFGGKRRDKMLDFVDPARVSLIEEVQPYKPTGVARLSVLERFSNADKHRLIHAAVANMIAKPEIVAYRAIPMPVTQVTYLPEGVPMAEGTEVARFKTNLWMTTRRMPDGSIDVPDSTLEVSAGLQAAMVFGERGKEDTRLKEFRSMLEDVRAVVARFA
jgi:hypothetical protein